MAGNGHILLREARDSANLTREELGNRVGVSKATIQRWECGESKPESYDVARMGQIVNDSSLWPRWMCEEDDEYARRHPYRSSSLPTAMAVAKVGFEADDVLALHGHIMRDLVDGHQTDKAWNARYIKELDELIAAAMEAKEKIQKGG